MIKKLLVLICLVLVTSCSVNKKDLYKLTVNEEEIIVGYSKQESIFNTFEEIESDEKGIISKITIYPKDYDAPVLINDIELGSSISNVISLFEGYESNGAGIVEKKVHGKINRIVFYNNILNDDLDELDHITITFE